MLEDIRARFDRLNVALSYDDSEEEHKARGDLCLHVEDDYAELFETIDRRDKALASEKRISDNCRYYCDIKAQSVKESEARRLPAEACIEKIEALYGNGPYQPIIDILKEYYTSVGKMELEDNLTNVGTNGEIWISDTDETRRLGRREAAYDKLHRYELSGLDPLSVSLIELDRRHVIMSSKILKDDLESLKKEMEALKAILSEYQFAAAELAGTNSAVDNDRLAELFLKHRLIASELQQKYT